MGVLISVVIPVYNAEHSLGELYDRLVRVFAGWSGFDYELVLVDDGSLDHSYELMNRLRIQDPKVTVVRLDRNYGQQNALVCGFHFVRGQYVVTLDDDLQHPPEEIPKLIAKLTEGYDAAFGVPLRKHDSFRRRFGSWLVGRILTLIGGKPSRLPVSSFRGLRDTVVREIIKERRPFVYLAPLIFRASRNTAAVTVDHEPRRYGTSTYTTAKLALLCLKLAVNYSGICHLIPVGRKPQYQIREIHR